MTHTHAHTHTRTHTHTHTHTHRELRFKALNDVFWTSEERSTALAGLTADDLSCFATGLRSGLYVHALVHGNMSRCEAEDVIASVRTHIHYAPLPRAHHTYARVAALPCGTTTVATANTNKDDPNSNIQSYFLVGGA